MKLPQDDTSIILYTCSIACLIVFLVKVYFHPEVTGILKMKAINFERSLTGQEPLDSLPLANIHLQPLTYNNFRIPPQQVNPNDPTILSEYDTSVLNSYKPVPNAFNRNFYFYNKMPKCGSTTLKVLLKELAIKNNFAQYIVLMGQGANKDDTEEMLVKDIYGEYTKAMDKGQSPFIAVKHETILNFTKFGKEQPTVFNIVRDPIDRFVSNYYFCRFGSISMPNYRCRQYPEDKRLMLVDDFFTTGHGKVGMFADTHYVTWLCGYNPLCKQSISKTDANKPAVYSYTKNLIMNDYLVIGVLEEFKKTLSLFEYMMPEIFSGALTTVGSEKVKSAAAAMKTNKKEGLSNSTRFFLERNQFAYDMDLYSFIRAKFHKQYETFIGPN